MDYWTYWGWIKGYKYGYEGYFFTNGGICLLGLVWSWINIDYGEIWAELLFLGGDCFIILELSLEKDLVWSLFTGLGAGASVILGAISYFKIELPLL